MTKIESKKVNIAATPDQVSAFLTNTDNIQKLLPEGKYSDWKSDGQVCSFKIQGAYTIGLRIKEVISNTNVIYESTEGSPFAFTLNTHISPKEAGSEAYLLCDAQLNPFFK